MKLWTVTTNSSDNLVKRGTRLGVVFGTTERHALIQAYSRWPVRELAVTQQQEVTV